jgi:CrcB protein
MQSLAIVFLGAGLGGVLRHFVNLSVTRWFGTQFPWGILIINITGSFVMGVAAGYFAFRAGANWSQHMRLFLTAGVLGGYTTFSAFSLDAILLIERGDFAGAAAYVALSVGLAIGGLYLGLSLVRALT